MNEMQTLFAPAERASEAELKSAIHQVKTNPLIAKLLDFAPNGIVILNQKRQIVLANRSILNSLELSDPAPVLGLRQGEAFQCVHSTETPGGCGTTESCQTCGAIKAILTSQKGKPDVQECRICRRNGDALDLRVWAEPFRIGDMLLTIFSTVDISDEKRRKTLERIFFHDILNTASGIRGFATLLKEAGFEEFGQYKDIIYSLSRMIVDEINSQRTLTAAENNELTVKPILFQSRELLQEIVDLYSHHDVAKDRHIRLDAKTQDAGLKTDRALLQRVIGNMVKNAIEACKPGETVTVGCTGTSDQVECWVHNPNEMPRDVQLQIFQRSFSTKGSGRGLGTYSIKLLTERYLKGSVSFTSSPEGTTFRVSIPSLQ